VRKSVDELRYVMRFTPRKPNSKWSAVNVRRVGELIAAGRMSAPGLRAFEARDPAKRAGYSFEERVVELDAAYARELRADARAWKYFQAQPPSYRRTTAFWVMSAKKDETRRRRFEVLLESSRKGAWIPPFRWSSSARRNAAPL